MIPRFPFPKFLLNTDIVIAGEEVTEDGIMDVEMYSGKCILDEKSRTIVNAERQLIQLSALVIIEGDINPGKDIQGYATFNGVKRNIYAARRIRNADGSVYSTEVDIC